VLDEIFDDLNNDERKGSNLSKTNKDDSNIINLVESDI
jgi:hypothetical protein